MFKRLNLILIVHAFIFCWHMFCFNSATELMWICVLTKKFWVLNESVSLKKKIRLTDPVFRYTLEKFYCGHCAITFSFDIKTCLLQLIVNEICAGVLDGHTVSRQNHTIAKIIGLFLDFINPYSAIKSCVSQYLFVWYKMRIWKCNL